MGFWLPNALWFGVDREAIIGSDCEGLLEMVYESDQHDFFLKTKIDLGCIIYTWLFKKAKHKTSHKYFHVCYARQMLAPK